MNQFTKIIFSLILISFFLFSFSGCSSSQNYELAVIRIKGSDTMLRLTELLAEEYMKQNPGVSIYVSGGGSATGIKALIRGEIEICTASRTLKPDEVKLLAEQYGRLGMSTIIAKDALSIYVSPDNPVKNFSIEDLHKIFTCQVTNWKELGGNDESIIPVIRPPNSGTHLYFREHILNGEEYCNQVVVESTTENVINFIEENEDAIGYGGIGYGKDIEHATINNIAPVIENVRTDEYPISRYLHFYTLQTPGGAVKDFIDWVLSPEGQKLVEKSGYIPLWEIPF